VKPGTKGLEHRIGGLEKKDVTGNIDYSPKNHQHMIKTRAKKVANIANYIPEQTVEGPASGKVLVISWGGTYGAVRTAAQQCLAAGKSVAHTHLRYMNPFPRNLGAILKSYEKVLVPELNCGQLSLLLRNQYLVNAQGYNKIEGKPFLVNELINVINEFHG
jgi:2-oxoglutarate ferredoxin oxidoreductase subunit alpha